jgi:4-amino-4-deoxy-L-arabinose transferase-like glycosyltransferase/membrane-associated phospholipid phosphatase
MHYQGLTGRMKCLLATLVMLVAARAVYPFDHSISEAFSRYADPADADHPLWQVLKFIRPFGKGEIALLITCALGLCGARRQAGRILLSLLLMTVLVWSFKLAIGRERPGQGDSVSFPSGDVATVAALATPLAVAFPWTVPAGALATVAVAAGRLCDGKHYPSDVLAGAAFGIIAGALALALLRRRDFRPPRAAFLLLGLCVLALDFAKLPWTRLLPNGLAFLGLWGPAAIILLVSRLGPTFGRFWRLRRRALPLRWLVPAGLAAILLIYLLLTTASTLWDRDEPRFARATVEMVKSGNYLVPTFNGSLRPDKPVLIYWLMSGPIRLFGEIELACRLVAPLATLVACLLTFWAGTQIAGAAAGAMALVMLALSPLMAVSGTAATTDALLLACMTASTCAFLLSWTRGLRGGHIVLLTLALGGALLTKGPVGLAVPLMVIASVLIFMRGGAVRPREYLPWLLLAVVAAVGLFLAWGLPANAATHGEFLRRGLGHHVLDRAVKPLEKHGGQSLLFAFYYLPVILFAFFPWTLYLPHFVRAPAAWPGAFALPARRVILCWALPVLILMSLVATKLPHYVLPAWPALAIAAAIGVQHARRHRREGRHTAAARTGLVLFVFAGLALGLGMVVAPWFLPLGAARVPAVSMGLAFVAMTYAGWRGFVRERHSGVIATLVCGMAIVLITAAFRLLPALEPLKISPRVAAAITRQAPLHAPVSTCGYSEPSLNFYLHGGTVHSVSAEDLAAWAAEPGEGVLVVTAPIYERQHDSLTAARIHVLAVINGFNYSQGKWIKVLILVRDRT